ncbi:tetratricopeptide repeat protein [Sulfobacillus harzensis]|uniref:Tetratricopeptide repeat protein n=1 Tax=Sulfobacillus harzensis TaxID=2729629 RepID=A0A7Y0Q1G0_9FIRM|nr:tetratricopeptide repeat protein [Sulfobacillus harzensis]NMP20791.1 tetratricopeptide repeat protein [Sulfobacillus harzensis]
MSTNEQIADLLRHRRWEEARRASLERLHQDRLDAQAWVFLGQSLIGLRRGHMAELCFQRANLLDPFASWIDQALHDCRSVPIGAADQHVLDVLAVPSATIAAVVLTRDSSRTIRQCLAPLQQAVDEIVVVDTGSRDDTVSMVESMGLRVHHFSWVDDFAAARNYSQFLVTAEWVIHVDSDEILYPEDTESVRTVAGLLNHKPSLVKVLQMNHLGDTISPALVARMFKTADFEWQLPVHEQVVPKSHVNQTELKWRVVQIRLFHDGYNPEVTNVQAKRDRNLRILRKAVTVDPSNPSILFHLGRELGGNAKYNEAIPYLEQAYALEKKQPDSPLFPMICLALSEIHLALNHRDDAREAIARLMHLAPDHPDGWFRYGLLTYESPPYDPHALREVFLRAYETGQRYRGPANFDPEIGTWKALYMLGVLAQEVGDKTTAKTLFTQVLQANPTVRDARYRLSQLD